MPQVLTAEELVRMFKQGAVRFDRHHLKGNIELDLGETEIDILSFREASFTGNLTIIGGRIETLVLEGAELGGILNVDAASIDRIDDFKLKTRIAPLVAAEATPKKRGHRAKKIGRT